MKRVKVEELSGTALDYVVAMCEWFDPVLDPKQGDWERKGWWQLDPSCWRPLDPSCWRPLEKYSTDWSTGGPIIERENINVSGKRVHRLGEERHRFSVTDWRASIQQADEYMIYSRGPTPLIAAMRCFVASKLGDTIEIPKELTGDKNDHNH